MPSISIRFHHGLGDAANAAHLLALYVRRQVPVEVECTPDKAPLFRAAGCAIVPSARQVCHWPHPPAPGAPRHDDPWSGNKVAWNVSHGPLPDIGGYWERWQELCDLDLDLGPYVPEEERQAVNRFLGRFPRPWVAYHPMGNTSPERKNLTREQQLGFLRGMLDRTDATVFVLDWDRRVHWFHNRRIINVAEEHGPLSTTQLAWLLDRADLFVGVDSGPLHLLRFTRTPGLGVWRDHFPSHFALPRAETLHLVPSRHSAWTRYRRAAWNLVEAGAEAVPGDEIAHWASRMLGRLHEPQRPYAWGATAAAVCVVRHLVERCRTAEQDRQRSFDLMFRHLDPVTAPRIVETGCIRAEEDFTAGFFTYICGMYLKLHGAGTLHSVDLTPAHVSFARQWTAGLQDHVQVDQADSRDWLATYQGPPFDLVYLDSADVGTPGYQECALREAELALPHTTQRTLLAFDDSPWYGGRWQGKGGLAIPWLLERGWRVVYAGYQVVLARPA